MAKHAIRTPYKNIFIWAMLLVSNSDLSMILQGFRVDFFEFLYNLWSRIHWYQIQPILNKWGLFNRHKNEHITLFWKAFTEYGRQISEGSFWLTLFKSYQASKFENGYLYESQWDFDKWVHGMSRSRSEFQVTETHTEWECQKTSISKISTSKHVSFSRNKTPKTVCY